MLLIGLLIAPQPGLARSDGTTLPQIYLNAAFDPASPVFARTFLNDIPNATAALDPLNYTSVAGAIVAAVYTVNGLVEPPDYLLVEGDAVAIRVTDDQANRRSFGVGIVAAMPVVEPYGDNQLQITGLGPEDFVLEIQNDDFPGTYTSDVNGDPLNRAIIQAQGGQVLIAPTLEGNSFNGTTLTAENGLAIIDSDPTSVTKSWQWMRDGSPITGAVSNEYTTQPVDAGSTLWPVELLNIDAKILVAPSPESIVIGAPQIVNTVTFQAINNTSLIDYVGEDGQPWSALPGLGSDMVILSSGVFPNVQGAGSALVQAARTPRANGMVVQNLYVAPQINTNTAIGAMLYDPVSGYAYVARVNGDNNRLEFYFFGPSNIRFSVMALDMSANLVIPTIALRIEDDLVSAIYDGTVIATRSKSADGFGDHIPGLRGFEKSIPAGSGAYVADFTYEELE